MYHLDFDSGDPVLCARETCALEHFHTPARAALHYEAITDLPLFPKITKRTRELPIEENRTLVVSEPVNDGDRETITITVVPSENLNDDFAAFTASEAANIVPLDLGNWRSRIESNALTNGDAHADANPDTSLVFGGYYDSTDE